MKNRPDKLRYLAQQATSLVAEYTAALKEEDPDLEKISELEQKYHVLGSIMEDYGLKPGNQLTAAARSLNSFKKPKLNDNE